MDWATTIHFVYPVGVALLMIVFFKEKRLFRVIGSAVLSLIGIAILSLRGRHMADCRGILFAFITVIAHSVYIVLFNHMVMREIRSVVFLFYFSVFNCILFSILSFVNSPHFQGVETSFLFMGLLGLTFISTLLPNLLFLLSVRAVGATVTSILCSIEPITATLVGIFYFHEPKGIHSLVGLLLILFSVIQVIIAKYKSGAGCELKESQDCVLGFV